MVRYRSGSDRSRRCLRTVDAPFLQRCCPSSRHFALRSRGPSFSDVPTERRPTIHWPHVLIFAVAGLAIDRPFDHSVAVDEAVAVDDDAADTLANGMQIAAKFVLGFDRDVRNP